MKRKLVMSKVVTPKSGFGFRVSNHQMVKFTDIEGLQVMDFVALNSDDIKEKFSQTHTRLDNNFAYKIGEGDKLFSNRGNPMFTIIEDKFKTHDMYFCSCNHRLYREIFRYPPGGQTDPYDGCFEHLVYCLRQFDIGADDIPDPFNINMHTRPDLRTGKLVIELPMSKAGDYILLRSEMNCIVGITSCPEEISACNGGKSTPIKVDVYEG